MPPRESNHHCTSGEFQAIKSLHESSSSNVGEGIAGWEVEEREARKQIKQEWEAEARENKKEIWALFVSWTRMGMARRAG